MVDKTLISPVLSQWTPVEKMALQHNIRHSHDSIWQTMSSIFNNSVDLEFMKTTFFCCLSEEVIHPVIVQCEEEISATAKIFTPITPF